MPDRLPSLIVLVGFWIPPAVAGWVAAGSLQRSTGRRPTATYAILATFVVAYAAAWFLFNLGRMPPYIPGAVRDPPSPRRGYPRSRDSHECAGVSRQPSQTRFTGAGACSEDAEFACVGHDAMTRAARCLAVMETPSCTFPMTSDEIKGN
jgi:hypothetical protein